MYKWFFKRLYGIELKYPPHDVEEPPNLAEEYLQSNEKWPLEIRGKIDLLDDGSEMDNYAQWAIGTFEIDNIDGEILVEFKGETLKNAGVDIEFDFSDKITLRVNPAIKEYYQVSSMENK